MFESLMICSICSSIIVDNLSMPYFFYLKSFHYLTNTNCIWAHLCKYTNTLVLYATGYISSMDRITFFSLDFFVGGGLFSRMTFLVRVGLFVFVLIGEGLVCIRGGFLDWRRTFS